MRERVRRQGPGKYRLRLPRNERVLIGELVGQLRDRLVASTDEPDLRRLFPPAYVDDREKDAGYQVLTRDDLLAGRLASLDVVEGTLEGGDLDGPQLTAWMSTVNALRLVLGTRHDIDEELPELDPADPEALPYAVYEYLGMLLSRIVDALAEDVGSDEPTEDPPEAPDDDSPDVDV